MLGAKLLVLCIRRLFIYGVCTNSFELLTTSVRRWEAATMKQLKQEMEVVEVEARVEARVEVEVKHNKLSNQVVVQQHSSRSPNCRCLPSCSLRLLRFMLCRGCVWFPVEPIEYSSIKCKLQ